MAGKEFDQRKPLLERIQEIRGGRALVCMFHFDRPTGQPLPGLNTQFNSDVKEVLFRVLKESTKDNRKVDLCLYSRGGDVNAVWPLVSLLREFDEDFEVLIPFRCHSSGTLLALGSAQIVMTPIGELSPIDPSTGNQFNPADPGDSRAKLAISVEDVTAYRTFVIEQFRSGDASPSPAEVLPAFLAKLVDAVHPLALGNVHRVHQQIKQLARKLLAFHPRSTQNLDDIVSSLTSRFYSHLHMINRHEAREILSAERIQFASPELSDALDDLLRTYEDRFALRNTFFLNRFIGDKPTKDFRFIGGLVESPHCSYLHETVGSVRQSSAIPPNVQVQIPMGQGLPLLAGVPRNYQIEVQSQGWVRNHQPKGVSL